MPRSSVRLTIPLIGRFTTKDMLLSLASRHCSVGRAYAWSHTVSSGTIGPSFKPHQCLLTVTWKETSSATMLAATLALKP